MRRPIIVSALLAALLAVGSAHAAGRADVRYVAPERFTDAGFGSVERERTQLLLTREVERLARRLPDGQLLTVEFIDVDLAGEVDWLSPQRLRVMGQLPDAPRLTLRFTLSRPDGQVLSQGEERLVDLAYLDRRIGLRRDTALPYESRLLGEWFETRIASAR